jgi:Sigma-70 factor, region 1.2
MLLMDSLVLFFTAASIDAFSPSQHSMYKYNHHVQQQQQPQPQSASSSCLAAAWYDQQQEQVLEQEQEQQQDRLWTNPVFDDGKSFRKVMDHSNNVMNEFQSLSTNNNNYHEQQQRQQQGQHLLSSSSNSETSNNNSRKKNRDDDDDTQSQELEQVVVRKVRANVKETGRDSMRDYIKTMCNHELLNKNEEVVLAREIQLLIEMEEEREKLEQHLIRYVITVQ